MRSIILAAGEGKRLRPFTNDRPKCLVEIGDRNLLDRILDVHARRISDIVVVGGYRSKMLNDDRYRLLENNDYDKTNMVETLFCAEKELCKGAIVSYGDIVYPLPVLDSVINSLADIAVAIDMNWRSYWQSRLDNPLEDLETLRMNAKMEIVEIGNKPKALEEIEGQYMGLMKFTKRGAEIAKKVYKSSLSGGAISGKEVKTAYMTDLLQAIIDEGFSVHAVPVRHLWVEIDTVDDLKSQITIERLRSIEEHSSAVF